MKTPTWVLNALPPDPGRLRLWSPLTPWPQGAGTERARTAEQIDGHAIVPPEQLSAADRAKLGAEPSDIMEDGHAAGSRLRIRHREGVLGAPHVRGVLERRGKEGEARYFLIDIAGPKAG